VNNHLASPVEGDGILSLLFEVPIWLSNLASCVKRYASSVVLDISLYFLYIRVMSRSKELQITGVI